MSDILLQATIFPPSSILNCHPDPFDFAQDKGPAKDLCPAAPAHKHGSRLHTQNPRAHKKTVMTSGDKSPSIILISLLRPLLLF